MRFVSAIRIFTAALSMADSCGPIRRTLEGSMTSGYFGCFIRRHCTMMRQHKLENFFYLAFVRAPGRLAGLKQNRSKCFPLMRQTGGNLDYSFPGIKAEGSILKPGN
jgi:hypothetical protein